MSALKSSTYLNITGDAGQEEVSRKFAYNPTIAEDQERIDARSIYVKGFGTDQISSRDFKIFNTDTRQVMR